MTVKYKQIKIALSYLLFFGALFVQGQTKETKISTAMSFNKLPSIQIGQDVPDVLMDKIVEVDGCINSSKLSDYKDKLLILDFMYTNCSSCIEGLVKKNRLQQDFGDKIKILVVVGGEKYSPGMLQRENAVFIQKFLTDKNYLSFHQVKIPWVVENLLLNDYFPHTLVSHLVWIYKGKLIAVTEQDYVTSDNIKLVLAGKKNDWPIKNDFMPAVDVKTPLVEQSLSRFNRMIAKNDHAAAFGAYQNGVYTRNGTVWDSIAHTRRDYHINLPILNLYKIYWSKVTGVNRDLQPSQILLEVKDPELYVDQEDSKQYNYVLRQKRLVSVEVTSPDTGQTTQKHAAFMIKELDDLFGLKGRYEKRKMKCLVFYRTDSLEKFKSRYTDDRNFNKSILTAPYINLEQDRLDCVVSKMNKFYGNPPVFDETNYKGLIDMKFTINSWMDIPSIRKAMKPYGLGLREEERELEVLVLTEKYR